MKNEEARRILRELENGGSIDNQLSMEQIYAIRVAQGALDDTANTTKMKELLRMAVEGFRFLGAWMDEYDDCTLDCSECPLHRDGYNCRAWKYIEEVEKLVGDVGDD